MQINANIQTKVNQIIQEVYSDCQDRGLVDTFIEPSYNTHEYKLEEGLKLIVRQEKNAVFYYLYKHR